MASIFTQIMQGKLPGHFVWEDDVAVAIMTIQPLKPGHVLVIPREEIDHWDDLSPEQINHLMQVSQTLTRALKKVFNPERVGMVIAGLEVPHTHIHLFPVNQLSDFDFSKARMAESSELADLAKKITQALQSTQIPEKS